jgi:hypothetical protein
MKLNHRKARLEQRLYNRKVQKRRRRRLDELLGVQTGVSWQRLAEIWMIMRSTTQMMPWISRAPYLFEAVALVLRQVGGTTQVPCTQKWNGKSRASNCRPVVLISIASTLDMPQMS